MRGPGEDGDNGRGGSHDLGFVGHLVRVALVNNGSAEILVGVTWAAHLDGLG